ncbi:MAG TPA: apolipoprotein N-acyltransferase [Steroidobacteraceae bacterium]|nr:apolipoprotein N-acyltransferase [Steroidobacteraceae bacterium]
MLATSFAPLQWWPLALLCPAALIVLWQDATRREAAWRGFWFNTGTFAAGTYWLYISIHGFGGAPLWIAFGLMAGLVGIMGLYGALLGYCVARWLPRRGALRWMLGIPAAWLLVEWWRGWFLSGFAWLSLGYSQSDTWLAGVAPVLGVYGISALLLLGAGALVTLVLGSARERAIAVVVLLVPWLAAAPLRKIEWTQAVGAPVSVAIIQGAIPQDQKWLDSNRDTTLRLYRELTLQALGTKLIVWPESAPPDLANNLTDYLSEIYRDASRRGSSLVLGVVRADGDDYYNSVLALGASVGWYNKRHLVPFAEFFPVPEFVRSWLRLMSLPYSDFTRGARVQSPLRAGGLALATTICYEDAYGSYELPVLAESDALVNVTNDAWFGHSSARYQHFQIARLRAMEAGRFMLRAANDGISAVIGPHGEVRARAVEYRPFVLRATITARRGLPPFARTGNWLIISLGAATLVCVLAWQRLAGAGGARERTACGRGAGTLDASQS